MCGIAGCWNPHREQDSFQIGQRMASTLQHRGPDDSGVWIDEEIGLMLAHRRLAIIDRSAAGHQPMLSHCERYAITYNGEIYNHTDIRKELDQHGLSPDWRGHSDTETLLAALTHWGIGPTLEKLNGMFAFALWDRQDRTLILARDRIGEKPLYYGVSGDVFLFGSELKALKVHPAWRGEIDRDALTLYFRHQYIPAPRTIFREIHKLPPAHYAVVRFPGSATVSTHRYWDLADTARAGLATAHERSEAELTDSLDTLLRDCVGKRMSADVPLGAFLSGGYDSTMVVAQMAAQSQNAVKTFSVGFEDQAYNEAPHAKAVAEHLGTDHNELYLTQADALATIPYLPAIWDEPFSDSSQIPTYLISQLAKQHVTVSLSGDGGDELFFGYSRYTMAEKLWGKLALLPGPLRQALGATLVRAPVSFVEQLTRLLPERFQVDQLADRLPKLATIVAQADRSLFYREIVSHWKQPDALVIGGTEPPTSFTQSETLPDFPGLAELMMYLDMATYLPDDILTKVDRASMAASLEARVPLIDHRLIEFAWQVPTSLKRSEDGGKRLFREVLYRYVPRSLVDRPKMGFGVPLEDWLRGPLRDWGESLLGEQKLHSEGFLNSQSVRTMWEEHISGKRRWHYYLWDVLMFEAWLDQNQPMMLVGEPSILS
jgi:asparagine synthase (glutamine-hydrolysing)